MLVVFSTALLFFAGGMAAGLFLGQQELFSRWRQTGLISPFVADSQKNKSLNQYSLNNLKDYPFATSQIKVGEVLNHGEGFTEYPFTYQTMGKTMSGLLTVPVSLPKNQADQKVIIMLRGWVPTEDYVSGIGTSPAARFFAQQGYITLAPDFFGYGQSDSEPADTWEARFIKPLNVIELIKSVREYGVAEVGLQPQTNLYLWAHSNGGQIALSVLEVLSEPIPTTLWAPVTAPFPYSILFFSDELEDEGKEQRAYIGLFEKNYNTFDFSVTQHLDRLTGPIQIHHGTADEAALKTWSDEFLAKIDQENTRREKLKTENLDLETSSQAELYTGPIEPIKYQYFVYPGADHNLKPVVNWNLAVNRDLGFFVRY